MAYNFSKYGVLVDNDNKLQLLHASKNSDFIGKKIRIEETGKD